MKPFIFKGRLTKYVRRFTVPQRGSVTIMTALMLPMIIGLAAISVDYGVWLHQKRHLQMLADIAAMGGVVAIKNGNTSYVSTYAIADAATNGFTANSNNTISVYYPPTSGANFGSNKAVQVILTKKATSYLSSLILSTPPTLHANAVGKSNLSNVCIITLNGSSGLTLNGNGTISSPACGIYVDSTTGSSITLNGSNASITTTTVTTAGGIAGASGIIATQGTSTYESSVTDPYATLAMPTAGSCSYTNYSLNGVGTLSPGTYCNGMDFKANAVATLLPGTYVVNGGSFSVNGQAVLTGTGVTIVLTGTSSNYASVTMNGGATVALSAPTSGTYKGIVFFGDRSASGVTHTFNGGSTTKFDGMLYTPASDMKFAGNNSAGGTFCTQIIANSLTVSGASAFSSGCTSSLATQVGKISLAE